MAGVLPFRFPNHVMLPSIIHFFQTTPKSIYIANPSEVIAYNVDDKNDQAVSGTDSAVVPKIVKVSLITYHKLGAPPNTCLSPRVSRADHVTTSLSCFSEEGNAIATSAWVGKLL